VQAVASASYSQASSSGFDLRTMEREARRLRLQQAAQAADSRAVDLCVATQLLPMCNELPAAVTARAQELLQQPHRHGHAEAALCSSTELLCPGLDDAASLFFACSGCGCWKPLEPLLEAAEEGMDVCKRELDKGRGGAEAGEQQ
jgi:hypothetical protein